jgi:hypothetical protein
MFFVSVDCKYIEVVCFPRLLQVLILNDLKFTPRMDNVRTLRFATRLVRR